MVNPDEEALVRCETTAGSFTAKMMREWSPNGYDRAVELFERHFYDGSHFFRVVPKFLVQFGISYSQDHDLQKFAKSTFPDDPPKGIEFHKGIISFAGSGDNSRTSHLFVSYGSADSLGKQKWETPIGEVIEGMENLEQLYSYGDMPPWGNGPVQGKIYGGPSYIEENFPKSDKFLHCKVERLNTDGDYDTSNKADSVLKKSDHKSDEEAFHQAREQQQRMEMEEAPPAAKEQRFLPHVKDQPGLPGAGLYSGGAVLCLMFLAMLVFNRRKKVEDKTN